MATQVAGSSSRGSRPAEMLPDDEVFADDATSPHAGLVEELMNKALSMLGHLKAKVKLSSQISLSERTIIDECFGRLALWGEVVPAGTLDSVLDTSDNLKQLVLGLAISLGQATSRGLTLTLDSNAADSRTHGEILSDFSTLLEIAQYLVGDSDSDDASSTSSDDESDDLRHLTDCCNQIESCTTSFLDIAPLVEKAVLRYESDQRIEQARPVSQPKGVNVSELARPFAALIQDRYREAENSAVEVLAEANARRAQRVTKAIASGPSYSFARVAGMAEETRSLLAPTSMFHDSGIGTTIAATRSMYAESVMSTASQQAGTSLRVPPMPSEASFVCPICQRLVKNVKNRVEWKNHVFDDLKPYVCFDQSCSNIPRTFQSRKQWLQHARTHEGARAQKDALDTESRDSIQGDTPIEASKPLDRCLLCREQVTFGTETYSRHIGRHMQSIALASLPRELMASEESDDDSDDEGTEEPNSDLDLLGLSKHSQALKLKLKLAAQVLGEPNFKCDSCPRTFKRIQNLKWHRRIHLLIKPHPCLNCDESFSRKEALKRHLKTCGNGLHASHASNDSNLARAPPSSVSTPHLTSTSIDPQRSEGYPDYPVSCICGFSPGEGLTVLCTQCKTRQHVGCYYYVGPKKIPATHKCSVCRPQTFDVESATQLQRELQKRKAEPMEWQEKKDPHCSETIISDDDLEFDQPTSCPTPFHRTNPNPLLNDDQLPALDDRMSLPPAGQRYEYKMPGDNERSFDAQQIGLSNAKAPIQAKLDVYGLGSAAGQQREAQTKHPRARSEVLWSDMSADQKKRSSAAQGSPSTQLKGLPYGSFGGEVGAIKQHWKCCSCFSWWGFTSTPCCFGCSHRRCSECCTWWATLEDVKV